MSQSNDGVYTDVRYSAVSSPNAPGGDALGSPVSPGNQVQRVGGTNNKVIGNITGETLARGLGFFSIGLGLTELLAPKLVARIAGLEGKNTAIIRLFGLREIMHGLAIFSQGEQPAGAVWSRVAGDGLDLAALALGALSPSSNKAGVAFATANVVGVTALDYMTAQQLSQAKGDVTPNGYVKACHSLYVNKTPKECYSFWRDFEQLPTFMRHLQSVDTLEGGITRWVAKGPAGAPIVWEAEITAERVNELIAWRSRPGAVVSNTGWVRFERAPGARGTIVSVEIEYKPPVGMVGATIAKLFREDPLSQLTDDMRRFKQIIEVGEIVRSDGSPNGCGDIIQRPAQPMP